MANVIRSQLQEGSLKAERLIQQMLPLLQKIKAAKSAEVCSKEVTRLKAENASLQKRVDLFIQRLDTEESEQGAKQFNRPKKWAVASASIAPAQTSSAAPTATAEKPAGKDKSQPKKENKGAKSAGGKSAGGKKAAAKADDKPVDITRLLLKVGKIIDIKPHPDADTLYIEQVEVGEENPRQILSGLVKHVPIDQMRDRLAVFACNLKPAKMRGLESCGMIMCASTPEKVQVIDAPEGAAAGDIVSFPGYTGEPDAQLNPKKKIWEALAPDMSTSSDCVACWKGAPFTINDKGVCTAQGCPNFPIK